MIETLFDDNFPISKIVFAISILCDIHFYRIVSLIRKMVFLKPGLLFVSLLPFTTANLSRIKTDLQYWIPKTVLNDTFVEETKFKILEEGDDIYKHEHVHVVGNIEDSIMIERTLVNDDLLFLLEDLSGYGCWCFFDEEGLAVHNMGAGHPVNDVDQMCKDVYICIRSVLCSIKLVRMPCKPTVLELAFLSAMPLSGRSS